MSRVLVTGGSGFLGSHIVDALIAAGHSVTVFDKAASRYLPEGATMRVGDLLDRDAVTAAVQNADVVFHLGGFADLNAARTRPLDTVQVNIVGTVNLLDAAADAGVERFVFASTVYVYSREGGFYRCSKQACESYIEEYRRARGLRYTIVRYGSLYGPRSDSTNGVHRLLETAMHDKAIEYGGSPDDLREYIHVEDAARLSADILGHDFEDARVLLTGNTALRASELFTMFAEILGHEVAVTYGESKQGHYSVTPYAYTPKPGRKLATNHFVDMGQGVLQLVERIHHAAQESGK